MSQAAAYACLTEEWQTTGELYEKALQDDPHLNIGTFTKNLLDLAKHGRAERTRPCRGKPAQWRLKA